MGRALILVGLVLAVALGGAVVALRSEGIQDQLADRLIAQRVGASPPAMPEGALAILFCGTGSPLPDSARGEACHAVMADGAIYLIDAGHGAMARLNRAGIQAARIKGVFLTHFHSDHMGGLGEVALGTWLAGRTEPLELYGPPGVEALAQAFMTAYRFDAGYRIAHHGEAALPPSGTLIAPHAIAAPGPAGSLALEAGGLRVTAFRVDHTPIEPAYGYVVEHGGRMVVFSGDTVRTRTMADMAKGADLLVHEALAAPMVLRLADRLAEAGNGRIAKLLRDTLTYHTTPLEAAAIANEAGVTELVFSHIVPPLPPLIGASMFLRGVAALRPDGVRLAEDGLIAVLPAGSKEIRYKTP